MLGMKLVLTHVLTVLTLAMLAGCGADGEPIQPSKNARPVVPEAGI